MDYFLKKRLGKNLFFGTFLVILLFFLSFPGVLGSQFEGEVFLNSGLKFFEDNYLVINENFSRFCENEIILEIWNEIFHVGESDVLIFCDQDLEKYDFIAIKLEGGFLYFVEGQFSKEEGFNDFMISAVHSNIKEDNLKSFEEFDSLEEFKSYLLEFLGETNNLYVWELEDSFDAEDIYFRFFKIFRGAVLEEDFEEGVYEMGRGVDFGNFLEHYRIGVYKDYYLMGFEWSYFERGFRKYLNFADEIEDIGLRVNSDWVLGFNLNDFFNSSSKLVGVGVVDSYVVGGLETIDIINWTVDSRWNVFFRPAQGFEGVLSFRFIVINEENISSKTNVFSVFVFDGVRPPKLLKVFEEVVIDKMNYVKYNLSEYFWDYGGLNFSVEGNYTELDFSLDGEILYLFSKKNFSRDESFYVVARNLEKETWSNEVRVIFEEGPQGRKYFIYEFGEGDEVGLEEMFKLSEQGSYFDDFNFVLAFILSILLLIISMLVLVYYFLPKEYLDEKRSIEYYEDILRD